MEWQGEFTYMLPGSTISSEDNEVRIGAFDKSYNQLFEVVTKFCVSWSRRSCHRGLSKDHDRDLTKEAFGDWLIPLGVFPEIDDNACINCLNLDAS